LICRYRVSSLSWRCPEACSLANPGRQAIVAREVVRNRPRCRFAGVRWSAGVSPACWALIDSILLFFILLLISLLSLPECLYWCEPTASSELDLSSSPPASHRNQQSDFIRVTIQRTPNGFGSRAGRELLIREGALRCRPPWSHCGWRLPMGRMSVSIMETSMQRERL